MLVIAPLQGADLSRRVIQGWRDLRSLTLANICDRYAVGLRHRFVDVLGSVVQGFEQLFSRDVGLLKLHLNAEFPAWRFVLVNKRFGTAGWIDVGASCFACAVTS